jgi:hypothetical protein
MLQDTSIVLGEPPWTFDGLASQWPDGRTDSTSISLISSKTDLITLDSKARQSVTLAVGTEYSTGVYYEATSAGTQGNLVLDVDDGGGSWTELGRLTPQYAADTGWTRWTAGSFTATGTSGRWRIRVPDLTSNGSSVWLIDDVWLGTTVAVKLSELAVDAAVTILKSNLGTELAAIDTDRSDSITLDVPDTNTGYFKHPTFANVGNDAFIEVFEASGYDFENPYIDHGDSRAVYEIPLTVRCTVYNRTGGDAAEMILRCRRMQAGVFNVFSKNPTAGGTDDAIKSLIPTRVIAPWEIDGEDGGKVFKVRGTLQALARCEEVQ